MILPIAANVIAKRGAPLLLVLFGVAFALQASANVALHKPARQSSTQSGGNAARAVDGNKSGEWSRGSVTFTARQRNPWWEVDLVSPHRITRIEVWNRTDCCAEFLNNFVVLVSDRPDGSGQSFSGGPQSVLASTPNPIVLSDDRVGRYVRVRLIGVSNLALAEVRVEGTPIGNEVNLALGRTAQQSSTQWRGIAARAVDGTTSGEWSSGSVTSTGKQRDPWWEVDLGGRYQITRVEVWNRTDCCAERLNDFTVRISDNPGPSGRVFGRRRGINADTRNPITFTGDVEGRVVRVALNGVNHLSLAEVRVFGIRPGTPAPRRQHSAATSYDNPCPGPRNQAMGADCSCNESCRSRRCDFDNGSELQMCIPVDGTGAVGDHCSAQKHCHETLRCATAVGRDFNNVASNRTARQSSTAQNGEASRAVDGNTSGDWSDDSVTHTASEQDPWWEVDLTDNYRITKVEVWNRTDCCSERLDNFSVSVSDTRGDPKPFSGLRRLNPATPNPISFTGDSIGRYVRVQLHRAGVLSLAEVRVTGAGLTGAVGTCRDGGPCVALRRGSIRGATCMRPDRELGEPCRPAPGSGDVSMCRSGRCDGHPRYRCIPHDGDGRPGDYCSHDAHCGSSICLAKQCHAVGSGDPGADCGGHEAVCRSGICDDSLPHRCLAATGLGRVDEYCTHADQCFSERCDGTCRPVGPLTFGASCSTHRQCQSGRCDLGRGGATRRCIPKDGTGLYQDYCTRDNHCQSGRRCRMRPGAQSKTCSLLGT